MLNGPTKYRSAMRSNSTTTGTSSAGEPSIAGIWNVFPSRPTCHKQQPTPVRACAERTEVDTQPTNATSAKRNGATQCYTWTYEALQLVQRAACAATTTCGVRSRATMATRPATTAPGTARRCKPATAAHTTRVAACSRPGRCPHPRVILINDLPAGEDAFPHHTMTVRIHRVTSAGRACAYAKSRTAEATGGIFLTHHTVPNTNANGTEAGPSVRSVGSEERESTSCWGGCAQPPTLEPICLAGV